MNTNYHNKHTHTHRERESHQKEIKLQYNTKEHHQANAVHIVIDKRRRPRHLDFSPSIPILQENFDLKLLLQKLTGKPIVK